MESDLRTKQRELENAQEDLRIAREEAADDIAESKELAEKLEQKELELEIRERRLLNDREEFSRLKRKFIEGILETGSYEKMTPEMRKMAKDLGVDVDELIEEDKRIQDRKAQLEALKKLNDEQMYVRLLTQSEHQTSKRKESQPQEQSDRRNKATNPSQSGGFSGREHRRYHEEEDHGERSRKRRHHSVCRIVFIQDTIEEFIKDLESKRTDLKKTKDELEMSKKLGEQVRAENKKIKEELDRTMQSLIDSTAQAGKELEKARNRQAKSTDTVDLVIQRPKVIAEEHATGGEDYFEMKRRIRDLEDELRRKGSDKLTGMSETGGEGQTDQDLRKLLDDIQREQRNLVENGDAPDRVRRIQALVYQFIYGILSKRYPHKEHLLRVGRIGEQDKNYLDSLVQGLRASNVREKLPAGSPDDLAGQLKDAYDTIAKLERKNQFLIEILQSMKATYEFFEFSNDQKVLANDGNPSVTAAASKNMFKEAY